MDLQTIITILLVLILCVFLAIHRKEVKLQKIAFPLLYLILYRSQLGVAAMGKMARRFSKPLKYLGYAGVIIGFIGMVVISISLVQSIITLLTTPTAQAGVALVLPIKAKGIFYTPPLYWLLSIFFIAVIHEFSHGVIARRYHLKVESSGFAFFSILIPLIPVAFVEPNEKSMAKKSARIQLSVFAAGPFSNILAAGVILLLSIFLINPVLGKVVQEDGVQITGFVNESSMAFPAEKAGIGKGEVIRQIDNIPIASVENFTALLETKKPGEQISIFTNRTSYHVVLAANPEHADKAYLGVYVTQHTKMKEKFIAQYGRWTGEFIVWVGGLFFWLFLLNLGIGLFNLVPLGPIDGGRMLKTALEHFFPQQKAIKYWKFISMVFLGLIVVNILFAFMR
ncbi:site-2 protease family protein [Candidatus Woesearchaeota archaeon]|nr:site-2 protease family protein [Candidatus Woesearchaeota archaeon]